MKYTIQQVCLLSFTVLCSFLGRGQETGIRFESGLSMQEIQAKAKAEKKLIFMDCYATWCGPCKFMEGKIYPDKAVGDYFNAHFVNVKVQMDKTQKDAQEVRDWYTAADSIAKKYRISAYPTYLFFSADGRALSQLVGSSVNTEEFIAKAALVQDPDQQYFTLLASRAKKMEDSAFLLHSFLAAKNAGDDKNARVFINNYFRYLKEPITKYNLELLDPYIVSESDAGFDLYVHHAAKIDYVYGKRGYAIRILAAVIFKDEVAPMFSNDTVPIIWEKISSWLLTKYPGLDEETLATELERWFKEAIGKSINGEVEKASVQPVEWSRISAELKRRFPGYDCDLLELSTEARYFYIKKAWQQCAETAISLVNRYGRQLGERTVNDITWRCIFLHSRDKKILRKAVSNMAKIVKVTPENPEHLDTYANLLYKTGHGRRAINWENKAINISEKNGGDSKEFKETLQKMQKGEITWEDSSEGI